MEKFEFKGQEVVIIAPDVRAENSPWVWRAEFLGAFDYADQELLKKGWHIAYYKLSDMYGCLEAVEQMKEFHSFITEKYKLNQKADMFGFSRGGLYATNYTLKFPDDVSTLYLDAPVLDIRSWPAGYGVGVGGVTEWEECKKWYGITEETARVYKNSPIHHIDELIKTNVPVILVAGDSDEVVPYNENGLILAQEYKFQNANIKVIVKEGVGHHPHSLENPKEIVEFIIKNK